MQLIARAEAHATGGLKAMGKGILSGVFWGIVASMLVAVVLTALSPLQRDQAVVTPPEDPSAEPATPQTVVSETTEPEAVEENVPVEPETVAETAPETTEPAAMPEPAPKPEVPEVAETVPEASPQPEPVPEVPEAPKVADVQPEPAVEPETEVEAELQPVPLPEVPLEETPQSSGSPVDLPVPVVVAELAVPAKRQTFDAAPETTVPLLDQAALSEAAVPGLTQTAPAVEAPSTESAVPERPRSLDGPAAPRPDITAGMVPDVSIVPDGEATDSIGTPALAEGEASPDIQPGIMAEPAPRVGALDAPVAPELAEGAADVPILTESDAAPEPAEEAPERVALATRPSDTAPALDTTPATPQPPKAPEATPAPQAPAAVPAPKPAETTPTPKAAPAPKPAEADPEVAVVVPEAEAPGKESQPDDRSASLPKVVTPGSTRPGGLPRVRRLGQLGSSSIGVGKAGPGLSQRMPRITAPAETPETPEGEAVPEAENPEPVGALERNAVSFSDDSGRPLMALVVVGEGDAASLVSRVDGLGGQVTVVLDPSDASMRSVAPDLKARGHEVLILANSLPANATPRDVEVSLSAFTSDYPDAIGILLPPDGAIASDRALLKQAMEFAAASGHAVVTAQSGLDTAGRIAEGAGARAVGVYRRLDGAGENASTVTRTLDRATFQAARDGNVAVLGGLGDQTIAGLTAWRAGLRGDSVVLAPLSALLLGGV